MRTKGNTMKAGKVLVLVAVAALVTSCVTINVFFPEAQTEKAAQKFIGGVWSGEGDKGSDSGNASPELPDEKSQAFNFNVLDFFISPAYAQDITIHTPAIQAIQKRMRQRFKKHLRPLFESGVIGLTNDALVAIRDLSSVPLAKRHQIQEWVAEENTDRRAVYREIAIANGHPEWEARIRAIFAEKWIANAEPGWWYQTESGEWVQK